MTIEALLLRYGLLAIFLGAGIEGETVVVLGGVMAHRGLVPLWAAALAAAAGSFLVDQLFFLAGRRFRTHPRLRKLTEKPAYARAMAALERHPTGFIFAFRFLYGLRTISPFAIGTSRIPARRFLPLNAAAALVWAPLFSGLGYVFGGAIEQVFGRLHAVEHIVLLILAAAVLVTGLGLAARRLWRRRGEMP